MSQHEQLTSGGNQEGDTIVLRYGRGLPLTELYPEAVIDGVNTGRATIPMGEPTVLLEAASVQYYQGLRIPLPINDGVPVIRKEGEQ